ncbi:MAG: hypothetical protein KDK48_03820, partial [Chlamydiia bacterium]|nr:hypothetical protein [Chlamydiia bacterium]
MDRVLQALCDYLKSHPSIPGLSAGTRALLENTCAPQKRFYEGKPVLFRTAATYIFAHFLKQGEWTLRIFNPLPAAALSPGKVKVLCCREWKGKKVEQKVWNEFFSELASNFGGIKELLKPDQESEKGPLITPARSTYGSWRSLQAFLRSEMPEGDYKKLMFELKFLALRTWKPMESELDDYQRARANFERLVAKRVAAKVFKPNEAQQILSFKTERAERLAEPKKCEPFPIYKESRFSIRPDKIAPPPEVAASLHVEAYGLGCAFESKGLSTFLETLPLLEASSPYWAASMIAERVRVWPLPTENPFHNNHTEVMAALDKLQEIYLGALKKADGRFLAGASPFAVVYALHGLLIAAGMRHQLRHERIVTPPPFAESLIQEGNILAYLAKKIEGSEPFSAENPEDVAWVDRVVKSVAFYPYENASFSDKIHFLFKECRPGPWRCILNSTVRVLMLSRNKLPSEPHFYTFVDDRFTLYSSLMSVEASKKILSDALTSRTLSDEEMVPFLKELLKERGTLLAGEAVLYFRRRIREFYTANPQAVHQVVDFKGECSFDEEMLVFTFDGGNTYLPLENSCSGGVSSDLPDWIRFKFPVEKGLYHLYEQVWEFRHQGALFRAKGEELWGLFEGYSWMKLARQSLKMGFVSFSNDQALLHVESKTLKIFYEERGRLFIRVSDGALKGQSSSLGTLCGYTFWFDPQTKVLVEAECENPAYTLTARDGKLWLHGRPEFFAAFETDPHFSHASHMLFQSSEGRRIALVQPWNTAHKIFELGPHGEWLHTPENRHLLISLHLHEKQFEEAFALIQLGGYVKYPDVGSMLLENKEHCSADGL